MVCMQCLRCCELHNITYCATCHKHESECDFGSCMKHATVKYARYDGDRLIEHRWVCETHTAYMPGYTRVN